MTANKPSKRSDALDAVEDSSFDTSLAYENLNDDGAERDVDMPDKDDEPSAKVPEKQSDLLAKVERATRIFASIGVAGAAMVAALQYWEANDGVRKGRSFEFVRQWQTQELENDFAALQVFVEERLQKVGPSLQQLKGPALDLALNNLGRIWLAENRKQQTPDVIEPHLENLTVFFSQIEICINARLCDEDVLESYFRSEVTSFWTYFSGYADIRRAEGYQEYGASVDELVKRFADSRR